MSIQTESEVAKTPSTDDGPKTPEYQPPVDGSGPGPQDPDDPIEPTPGGEAPTDDEIDDIEELEPKTLPVERVIMDHKGRDAVYTQQGLMYFGKIELYGLLGRAVQIAMEGENGMGVDDILDIGNPRDLLDRLRGQLPEADTSPDAEENSSSELQEAAKMLASFAKVISFAPDILKEAYCIILAIPKGHRMWAMEWGLPQIDDEMGSDILHTFIDQNWGVMEDFFAHELPKIFKRAAQARKRHRSAGGR